MSWDKDYRIGQRRLDRLQVNVEKALLREYAKALRVLRSEIADAYAKYDMSYGEMMKYNRLTNLEKELRGHVQGLMRKTSRDIRNGVGDIFGEAYYTTAWATERQIQAKLSFALLNSRTIEAAVMNPISGLTLDEILERNRYQIILKIKQEVTQGILRGESYQDMASRITDALNGDAEKAIRITRTEGHRAQVVGRIASIEHAEEQGVKGRYVWDAALDDRTRDDHRAMDGEYADEDGWFTLPDGTRTRGPGLSGDPSQDINCRCSIRYEITGFEPKTRRIRGEGVVPYTTYEEWYENRIGR